MASLVGVALRVICLAYLKATSGRRSLAFHGTRVADRVWHGYATENAVAVFDALNSEGSKMLKAEQDGTSAGFPHSETDGEVSKLKAALTDTARGKYPEAENVMELISDLYNGNSMNAFQFNGSHDGSAKATEESKDSSAHTYGEILPPSVVDMFAQVGARPGMRYYDLGSGTGKTVRIASFLGLNATGVELVEGRYRVACRLLPSMGGKAQEAGGHASFVFGSFLKHDFSDADLVFTDSVLFNENTLAGLSNIARKMKPGSYVISANGLPGQYFQTEKTITEPTSWSSSSQWTVQKVLEKDSGIQEEVTTGTNAAPTWEAHEICDFPGDEMMQSKTQLPEQAAGDKAAGGIPEVAVQVNVNVNVNVK